MGTEHGGVLAINMRKRPTGGAAATAASASSASAPAAPATVVVDPAVISPQDLSATARHHGPVRAIQRNPFHPSAYVTLGDWSARLWHDKNRGPVWVTPYCDVVLTAGAWVVRHVVVRRGKGRAEGGRRGKGRAEGGVWEGGWGGWVGGTGLGHIGWPPDYPQPNSRHRLSIAGCWSNARPAVFYGCRQDGRLDVWDLMFGWVRAALQLDARVNVQPPAGTHLTPLALPPLVRRQSAPAYTHHVSDVPLSSIAAGEGAGARLVAVGDEAGTVHLLEASHALATPQPDERGAMGALLERASRQEEALEKRAAASSRAARVGMGGGGSTAAGAAAAAALPNDADAAREAVARAEAEFYAAVGMSAPG